MQNIKLKSLNSESKSKWRSQLAIWSRQSICWGNSVGWGTGGPYVGELAPRSRGNRSAAKPEGIPYYRKWEPSWASLSNYPKGPRGPPKASSGPPQDALRLPKTPRDAPKRAIDPPRDSFRKPPATRGPSDSDVWFYATSSRCGFAYHLNVFCKCYRYVYSEGINKNIIQIAVAELRLAPVTCNSLPCLSGAGSWTLPSNALR